MNLLDNLKDLNALYVLAECTTGQLLVIDEDLKSLIKIQTSPLFSKIVINNEFSLKLILLELEKDSFKINDYFILEEFPTNAELAVLKEQNRKVLQDSIYNIITIKPPENVFVDNLSWQLLLSSVEMKMYPLFLGPKGAGKTTIAKAVANALGYKFYKLNCGQLLKPKQALIGMTNSENGSTHLTESLFLKHFRSDEKVLIFLDEFSRTPSIASNYIITILDEHDSFIYIEDTGEIVYKGPNVVFLAAANFGFEYTDTRLQDGAVIDRFIRFQFNYLSIIEETKLIKAIVPNVNDNDLKLLLECINLCRDNIEKIQVGVSTRQAINFSKLLSKGYKFKDVFNLFLNLFKNGDMDESENVKELLKSKF